MERRQPVDSQLLPPQIQAVPGLKNHSAWRWSNKLSPRMDLMCLRYTRSADAAPNRY